MSELLGVLGPHQELLGREVDAGADASVTIVGEVLGGVISTAEEAERRRYASDTGQEFEPSCSSSGTTGYGSGEASWAPRSRSLGRCSQ
jgi:hypothetical protein